MLVIGSGPAGESAAINAAKHGKRVGVIEEQGQVGGNCTLKATIPSKVLRHAIKQLVSINRHGVLRDLVNPKWFEYPLLLDAARSVIRTQVGMRRKFYVRNRIDVVHGVASFVDATHLDVQYLDGGRETLSADTIFIATGSGPYHPPEIDFSHPRVYDSDTILEMQHTPRKLILFGAGVIGCEYTSVFAGMGIKVELVNTRDRLLTFLDDEISDALGYHLRDLGAMIRHREEFAALDATDHGVTLHLKSGKALHADALLWCNGRTGNTARLNLEAVGLQADHRGHVSVNHHYQTPVDNIYAVGDVIGWPSLASAAYNQGRSAAAAARGKLDHRVIDDIATGIYTIPEISSVGRTERELTETGVPYEVGRAFFKDTARGQISGEDVGVLKILFQPDSRQILGIHCFGAEATEIIHIGQAIMNQRGEGNTIDYFIRTTFNYPTMAEAYRIAAFNGVNRLG